jgi:putative ABC transport system permease protein
MVGHLLHRLERTVDTRVRDLLTADLEVSSTRAFTPEEEAMLAGALPAEARVQAMESLVTMAHGGEHSRPVHLLAVADAYPWFGALRIDQREGPVHVGEEVLGGDEPAVLVQPELLEQLTTRVGARLRLGTLEVRVAGTLVEEPGVIPGGFGVGPRVLLNRRFLPATGLASHGSRVRHARLVALADAATAEERATALRTAFGLGVRGTPPPAERPFRVRTGRDAAARVRRVFDRFADYLRLVALAAMLVGGMGVGAAARAHLASQRDAAALLGVLGASPGTVARVGTWQVLGAAVLGAGGGAVLGLALGELAGALVEPTTGVPLARGFSLMPPLVGACLGLGAAMAFARRALAEAVVPPAEALRAAAGAPTPARLGLGDVLVFGLALWAAAALEARSATRGLLFASSAGLGALGLHLLAGGSLALAARLGHWSVLPVGLRLGLSNLTRPGLRPRAGVVTLGFTALLFSLLVHLEASLRQELRMDREGDVAGLFLIDVQEDQLPGLRELVAAQGLRGLVEGPMVLARLTAIDGQGLSQGPGDTRESQARFRFQQREQRLSFRVEPGPDETVVAGTWLDGRAPEDAPVEVSAEERWARRVGVGLGGTLTFDVLGVPVEATVTSLRRVRWTSFRPNYFLLLSPHALRDAPKVYVASLPPLEGPARARFLAALAERLPNVTAFDVGRQLGRVRGVLDQLFLAVRGMAMACLLAGLVVVAGMGLAGARARRADAALLATLGATPEELRRAMLGEFLALGAVAGVLGGALALGLAIPLIGQVFEIPVILAPGRALGVVAVAALTSAGAGWVACRGATHAPPREILREG